MRTSDETIRELERLNAERTQGEWAVDRDWREHGADQIVEQATGRFLTIAFGTSDGNDRDLPAIAAAVNALPNLLADLRDLAAMEQRDRDGPCYYCGEMTEKHAGNPSRWPVYLCHADDPGVSKPHHAGCVSERLKERDAAVKLAAENEAAFDGKAEEFDQLAERLAERTAERDAAIQERDEARAALTRYGDHDLDAAIERGEHK